MHHAGITFWAASFEDFLRASSSFLSKLPGPRWLLARPYPFASCLPFACGIAKALCDCKVIAHFERNSVLRDKYFLVISTVVP